MTKVPTYGVVFSWLTLSIMLMGQCIYFFSAHALSPEKIASKEAFSELVGLPDLALVNEANYVRHRSLSGVFAYFNESPELLEYFPSTFVYRYAPYTHPSRIERVF